jgi:hypothetical protein
MAHPGMPTRFPIFPLPSVVLFPGVRLPLHVFEPRYRRMTADSLESERVIGMTLLRSPIQSDQGRSPVYEVGCAGRISQCAALPDGRYNLILDGELRFRIRAEVDQATPYRIVEADLLLEPPLDSEAREELGGIAERVRDLVHTQLLESAPSAAASVEQRLRALDPCELINTLAFGIDIPVVEK